MTAMLLLLAAAASGPDSLDSPGFTHSGLISVMGTAEPVDGEVRFDRPLFDFCETLGMRTDNVTASVSVSAARDSVSRFGLRRGTLEAIWPGTPWISGRVGLSDRQPFLPGLSEPVLDFGWRDPDSLVWLSAAGGGILGATFTLSSCFSGGDDTLTVFEAGSPWLGILAFDYTDLQQDSAGVHREYRTLSAGLDIRHVRPWILLAGSGSGGDSSALVAEIRGIEPLDAGSVSFQVVPLAILAGDSAGAPGGAYAPGDRIAGVDLIVLPREAAIAGIAGLRIDMDDPGCSSGSFSAAVVSQGGFLHRIGARDIGGGDWTASASTSYMLRNSSCGLACALDSDSLGLTGSASYSPVAGVHVIMELSADPDGSLDPRGRLAAAVSAGSMQALLGVSRVEGETLFMLSARCVLE